MFKDEKALIEQVVFDYGNYLEVSPIVHCELAWRGVEYVNGRATWNYRNRCTGKLAEMESLCRYAYGNKVIPQHLMGKYERRVRDYMRSYRMGSLSAGLEKMRAVIKTHRNMLDSYDFFIKSDSSDDTSDTHSMDYKCIAHAVDQALSSPKKQKDRSKAYSPHASCRTFHLVRNCTCLAGICA
jgi:hypothetical protein